MRTYNHSVNNDGEAVTALLLAVSCSRDEEVERLLATGLDVNLADSNGITPLMISAVNGYVMIARLLLGAGADPRVRNKWGVTAFAIATYFGHRALAAMLECTGVTATSGDLARGRQMLMAVYGTATRTILVR